MISIKGLTTGYGKQVVLNKLDLEIPDKTIHGLVGMNGAGKTTLLNTLYGIKSKQEGAISFYNKLLRKDQMAYLETETYFYPGINGLEYLKLFQTQNKSFDIDEWNNLFNLPLKKLIDSYSTGMKKKLALMGILCLNRPIIILDEPFNGVDLETVQKLKSLILNLKEKGHLILITSHILESLINICDAISYLNNKSIQFTMPKRDFDRIEKEIFQKHQDEIDKQTRNLLNIDLI